MSKTTWRLWPQKWQETDATLRTCWGYSFHLAPEHMGTAETEALKQSCDRLADQASSILDDIPTATDVPDEANVEQEHSIGEKGTPPSSDSGGQKSKTKKKRDLYVLLRDNAARDPILAELWTQVTTVPPWVDWSQIERGQEVFYRYGGPALMGLAFQSLLGGMGSGRVVETLSRTGGFSTKVARQRLLETTQHILQCTRSLESIQPGGDGFASSIRVRLLHAAVRRRIMALAAQDADYYDASTLGIPINDLDCIATIVTFSASLIWIAFPRQGIFIRKQEAIDYIALWRYIAYLTGTPSEYFQSTETARRTMEILLLHEIQPSPTSQILAHNVIECLACQPPNYSSREFLVAYARWLNGDELCDELGLQRTGWYAWSLVAGQVLFSMWVSYTTRAIRALDRRKIALLRRIFWDILIASKDGLGAETLFDYKYIPRLGKTTKLVKGAGREGGERRIEKRNFYVFVGASLVFAVCVGTAIAWTVPVAYGFAEGMAGQCWQAAVLLSGK